MTRNMKQNTRLEIPDIDNAFGEDDEQEIQYYDTAFPSLDITPKLETSQMSIPFSNDYSEMSLVHSNKCQKSSQTITTTFAIPFEERKFIEPNAVASNVLKRNLSEICSSCGVRVESHLAPDQSLRIFISGEKQSTLDAKKRIMRLLQTQNEIILDIPKEFHRNLIGAKGNMLKELESESATQISIPKPNENSNSIRIRGTKDSVEHAKQIIQRLIDEISKVGRQVVEIDKRYHQLVCHKSNTSLHVVVDRKNLRIDIPPFSVNKNEISISGEREGVAQAASILKQTYNNMRNTYQELQIEIPKEKHRFIIGPKGSGIKEILDQTNVWVEINDSKLSDSSPNTICLLGPKENLGPALTMVFMKSESVNVITVEAPGWLHKYIIGKNGSNLVNLTQDKVNIHLSFETESNQIVIEGSPEEAEEVSEKLKKIVFDFQSYLTQTQIEIDPAYIKHVIGAGGSNIQKIRKETNCNIRFPMDPSKRFVTIVGSPSGVEAAKALLLKTVEYIENTKRKDIIFTHYLIPQLIGQNGRGLKEIKEKYPDVRFTIPSPEAKIDLITLIGPRKDVDSVGIILQKKHSELIESNYSEKISIPRKFHKVIIGREGITIKDLTKTTNTKFQIPNPDEEKDDIIITGKKEDVKSAIQKVLNIYEKESNIIEVGIEIPKSLHTILIGKGGSRINNLKESCGGRVTIRFPAPESESNTVIVKGIKDDVFKAQEKLHDLVEEVTASNYEETFVLTPEESEFFFASPEVKIRKLKESFGIRILDHEDQSSIRIVGQKENVTATIELLSKAKSNMGQIITDSLNVHIDHIVYFQKSFELNRIRKNHQCKISVPQQFDENNPSQGVLEFHGPQSNVQLAKDEILQIIDDYENSVTDSLMIDEKQLDNLRRFSQRQLADICLKYKVEINVPLYPESTNSVLETQFSTNSTDCAYVNGLDSSFSEEESCKSLSPHSSNIPNGVVSESMQNHIDENDSQFSSTISMGITSTKDIISQSKLPKYRIIINGHKDKIETVKEEIIKIMVLDVEVYVPDEFYPALIGSKGSKINELREKYNCEISIPPRNGKNKKVIVTGQSDKAVAAKTEILNFVELMQKQREERILRNYRLNVSIPVQYHKTLIGFKGETISKLRTKYSVKISIPPPDGQSDEITIQGLKSNVEDAQNEILKMIHRLESKVIEDLVIDNRIHSRLIGSRGANLEKLRKKYNVEIAFPIRGTEGREANIVKIKGTKEGVDKCADELIDRANEMLEDLDQTDELPPPSNAKDNFAVSEEASYSQQNPKYPNTSGFQIRDAPWQTHNANNDDSNTSSNTSNWANVNDDEPIYSRRWTQVVSKQSNRH